MPGGKGWNTVRCPRAPASVVPALVWRSSTEDPPPGAEDPSPPTPGASTPGGSPFPPPSAIDPAELSQTWRFEGPPAAPGTKGSRTNYVPPEAGWCTATTPRKVESPSSPAAPPNATTRSAHPTQLGGGRAKLCRRVLLSGNTRPGRKPQRAHTHGVDRGETPRATNTRCVTGSLLARVEGLEATLTPRPLIPSVPLRPYENFPQTPSKDPQKTLLRHPQRTLRKPSPQGPWGQTQRRKSEASNTALRRGGGRVLRDTLAAPRGQGRGVM